jgi:CHASE2 domain-containing sensor protein
MSIDEIADRELPHLVKVIEERKSGWAGRLSKSKLALLVIALLVFLFQIRGLPDKFASQSLDAAVAVQRHVPADTVALLVINDDDYLNLFTENSPLNPETLSRLLEAIASGGAKAIVVDIETSSPKFATMKVPSTPTVWAMVGTRTDKGIFTVRPPLGGRALPSGSVSSIALVPNDDRGIVRGYRRVYPLKGGEVSDSPGYALASLLSGHSNAPETARRQDERYLDFRYDFAKPFNAGNTLTEAASSSWNDLQMFKNKVVVVGATYWAARDLYATPAGPRFGCEIVAQEVQAELDGTSIAPASRWLTGLLLVLGGFATVAIYHWFKLRAAFIVSLISIPLLSVASNWILFHRLSAWGAMVPLVSAVIIAELYAQASLYLDLLKKVSAAKSGTDSTQAATDDPEALSGPL